MKRLFAIGLSLLMLVGFSANAVAMSDCALQRYVDWNEGIHRGLDSQLFGKYVINFGFKWTDGLCGELAVAPDGSWATGTASTDWINGGWVCRHISYRKARTAALKHCNERFNTDSCRIPKYNEFAIPSPSYETIENKIKLDYRYGTAWVRAKDGRYFCVVKDKPPYLTTPKECKAVNGVRWWDTSKAYELYLYISTDSTPIFGRPEDDANCGTATATAPSTPPKQEEPKLRLLGTGTGFLVNKDYIVTAEHVLEKCNEVTVRHAHKEYWTTVAARDPSNDLGLLQLEKPLEHYAKLRGGKAIRLGESISTYGYPLFGELSDSAKITKGNINSLAGIGNDSRVIQFDAPTQPGNSGGPVLDSSGNVVGVVSHGLSKRYADQSGHIAQNVNFAVKSYLVEGFLSSNNVSFEKAESTEKLELPDIAEKAEKFTVLVGCWE